MKCSRSTADSVEVRALNIVFCEEIKRSNPKECVKSLSHCVSSCVFFAKFELSLRSSPPFLYG